MKKTKAIILWTVAMILFWTNGEASPLGYSSTDDQASSQEIFSSKTLFRFDPKSWLDVDIWIKVDPDDDFSDSLFDGADENKGATVSVTAYLFSYGAYLHEWELPFFETWTQPGFVWEKPFEYKGPLPIPGYASGPVSGKFEYPYAQLFPKGKQGPSPDAFSRKYGPPEERTRFAYPHEQLAPKGPAVPAAPGPRYASPGGGPGERGTQGGQTRVEESYQYGAPTTESGYPYGQSPTERRLMEEQLSREKSGIGGFRQEIAVSRTAGKPYGMILLGAGLAAVAALFRMFKLSLFIMVGWIIFYGRDIWRIIVDLV